ncbi:TonB-dependent receptor [Cellvibrio zantedeschiae]|uniref:TonB-dependent receptor n=1 Tax=Cellvibrio zantedeschiae TaxID=1237077 RepID=A0ABQ3B5S7_9GAMM|nr:TonB-dependent receptor [Cellvibrio zantedeschiae]GGY74586.1 TonB-dependent receptor [Cellvibrio zantedeschiae]
MSFKSFALTPISAALLSIAFIPSAFAVDEKIETVVVSATRSEGPAMPVATQIKVIDAEQIRLSGATTITEILRTQAGIQIQDLDGSGGRNVTVAMRGFSANASSNTLVLVDGRKLNNPSLAGPALNTVAVKDVERVEIVQGSAGVLYGDQAVGGVINIITRKAKAGDLNAVVSAESGNYDLKNYTASVSQGFNNGLSYNLSAQKRELDNYRENNRSEVTNVLGKIAYDFELGNVFIEKQKIEDELGLPGNLLAKDAVKNPRHSNTPDDYSNQDTDLSRVGGEVKFLDNWSLLAEYSDRDETGEYLYEDYDKTDGYYPYGNAYEMRVKNLTPRLVGSLPTANGNAVITFGYDQVDADYSTEDGYTDISQKQQDVYAQVIYPATKTVTLNAGLRHASVDDKNRALSNKHSDSVNIGEFGINYQIDSNWRVFGRYADGFRFANADENGFVEPDVDFLEVQTSKSQELGLAWTAESASVKYSLFNMVVDNEIMYDPMAGAYGANINLPESERQGLLFDGEVQLSEQVGLHGNYTYTDAELTSGSFKDKAVPYVAKNTANLGIVFTFIKNINVSIDANYIGSRYLVGDNANSQDQVDPVTLFNLNILWDINALELGLRVKNLTGEKYSDYEGTSWRGTYLYPQPKQTYSAHATYRF